MVVDIDQTWELSDRSAVTLQLIGVDDLRNVVFTQEPGQKGLCSLGVAVALQQNFEYEAVLVHCPPQPVVKLFGEEGRELDTPFAQRLVEEWRPHGRPFTTMLT